VLGNESVSRRGLFSILPAGCLGCAGATMCSAQAPAEHSWTEKSDMTWEDVFRFSYQKDYIPLLKELAEQVGREKFVGMIQKATTDVVMKKAAQRPKREISMATLVAGWKTMPPLMQHALTAEIVEETATSFEYKVTKCLWAKSFLESKAGDIGYAAICYPDYVVASSLNSKLKLVRTKTLMQGDDHCNLRYVMEG